MKQLADEIKLLKAENAALKRQLSSVPQEAPMSEDVDDEASSCGGAKIKQISKA